MVVPYPGGRRTKRLILHEGAYRLEAYPTEKALAAEVAPKVRHVLTKTRTNPGGIHVKNPLDSIWGTVICGFILTGILYYVATLLVAHSAVGGS